MLVNGQEFTNTCELTFEVCLLQRLVGPFAQLQALLLQAFASL